MTLPRFLYELRAVYIPALVYASELSFWAILMRSGYIEPEWMTWRICLFVGTGILLFTGLSFFEPESEETLFAALGVILPVGAFLLAATVCWFVNMNLNFLTIEWFYYLVLYSGFMQAGFTVTHIIC